MKETVQAVFFNRQKNLKKIDKSCQAIQEARNEWIGKLLLSQTVACQFCIWHVDFKSI